MGLLSSSSISIINNEGFHCMIQYKIIVFCSNFTNNFDPGGIVNLGFNNAEFHGLNRFENNIGPSLRVSSYQLLNLRYTFLCV